MIHHPLRAMTLAALGALIILSGLALRHASADEPHAGLKFSLQVQSVPGCNTRASDVTCTLPAGQPFVLEVWLDALPDDIPSYKGYDLYVEFAGVRPGTDASTDIWPDCGFPVSYTGAGFLAWGCAIGIPPASPSSWIGPIGTVTFTCAQSGSLSLRHGHRGGYTDLVQDAVSGNPPQDVSYAEGADTRETITINCETLPVSTPGVVTRGTPGGPGPSPQQLHATATPVGGTPQPGQTLEPTAKARATATAKAKATPGPGSGDDGGGVSNGVWIAFGVAAAAVVAVGAAGGGYWYFRNRGAGTGGTPPAST